MRLDYSLSVSERRTWLAGLLFVIYGCATADRGNIEGRNTELSTFSDFQISQTRFCPEEPVVIFAKMTNTFREAVDLRLGPNRALVQITNTSNRIVWDTDEWYRIEDERYAEEHGMGRIVVGPTIRHMKLGPGASAYWISRWEQRDLAGDYVDQGEYSIKVNYRWMHLSDDESLIPIHLGPTKILITERGCD